MRKSTLPSSQTSFTCGCSSMKSFCLSKVNIHPIYSRVYPPYLIPFMINACTCLIRPHWSHLLKFCHCDLLLLSAFCSKEHHFRLVRVSVKYMQLKERIDKCDKSKVELSHTVFFYISYFLFNFCTNTHIYFTFVVNVFSACVWMYATLVLFHADSNIKQTLEFPPFLLLYALFVQD